MKNTRVNLVTITERNGRFDATVQMHSGFTEEIEGLYDVSNCLAYGRMHVGFQNSIYNKK